MVRRDGAEVRRDRIKRIAQYIQKELYNSPDGWILLDKTVAILMLEHGLTKVKLMEYLEILQTANQFEIDFENNMIKKIGV
jgi:hypothetical protein